jgi:hypothetical protein
MTKRYFGEWNNPSDPFRDGEKGFDALASDFVVSIPDDVKDEHILFAAYSHENYEGRALVGFQRDGKLYEVHAFHCSCNGLEECWSPEETTWAELKMRKLSDLDEDARTAFAALVAAHAEGGR